MNETNNSYSPAQRKMIDAVFTKENGVTIIDCSDEETRTKVRNLEIKFKQAGTPELEKEIMEIYNKNLYCAHCHKPVTVTGSLNDLQWSCDCEGAKTEIKEKEEILKRRVALDEEFLGVQKKAINSAFVIFREKYAEAIAKRNEDLKKFDDEILGNSDI